MRFRLLLALPFALTLTGCGIGTVLPPTESPGAVIQGRVIGGQNPISGSQVYLYAANTTGYGQSSVSLLRSANTGHTDSNGNAYVLTNAAGNFTITGDYSCTANTQVYLYAVGGNPGSGSNPFASLMAVLGNCPAGGTFSSGTFVNMNEVTTVASAYALAGYAVTATMVSSSNGTKARAGIANAFANVNNLVNTSTGVARTTTPGGNGTVPQQTINTLANILSSCVNSAATGVSSNQPSSGCQSLFSAAGTYTFGGTTYTPTETVSAILNIAHHPGKNVSTLFGLVPSTGAPFAPSLPGPGAPNDFSLSIIFTPTSSTSFTLSYSLGIDGSSNVWVSDQRGNNLTKFNALGVKQATANNSNLSNAQSIAIDASNNVWVTDPYSDPDTVYEFNSSGTYQHSGSTNGHINELAIDASGNLWATSASNTSGISYLSEFSSTGSLLNAYTTGLSGPFGIAIDHSNNIWAGNQGSLAEYSSGAPNASSPYTNSGMNDDEWDAVRIDASNTVWTVGVVGYLAALPSSGGTFTGSPFSVANSGNCFGLAIDGQSHIYDLCLNYNDSHYYVMPFDDAGNALADGNGLLAAQNLGFDMEVDSSGDIWIPDEVDLVEMIGVALPVETPMVQALKDNCLGQLPCN